MIHLIDSLALDGRELESLLSRSVFDDMRREEAVVLEIIEDVRRRGDDALRELTARYDGVELDSLEVTEEDYTQAYGNVGSDFLEAVYTARDNIADFSRRQLRSSWFDLTKRGSMLGEMVLPLSSVGCYVPGGTARYPSSVLMTAVPATTAGVGRVAVTSPPGPDGRLDPHVLVAAAEAGVSSFYKIGGAQAVAALAYGTESIARVDKIVGPGNIYVTLAKRAVYGQVGIDMLAGPSEVLVLADGSADAAAAAADLLAQAEHDPNVRAILITTDAELGEAVIAEVERQLQILPRREIAAAAMEKGGLALLAPDMEAALEMVNAAAPEHLILLVEDPYRLLPGITAAGAVFLGPSSPESVGDYLAGPSHVLPTGGTARFSSPLSAREFLKSTSLIGYSPAELRAVGGSVELLAAIEGLEGHARAVRTRLDSGRPNV